MASKFKISRSATAGNRPTNTTSNTGELYTNFPDMQLGVHNIAGDAMDLLAIRFHSDTANYVLDDLVYYNGGFQKCINAHSAKVFDQVDWGAPSLGTPGDPIVTTDFTSDLLGEATGNPGGIVGPHSPSPTPDENGPYFFSVIKPSTGKAAEVYVDGFMLRPDEYSTVTDGYVLINSSVSDNSWVQITI